MKNKILVVIVTLIYALSCMSLTAFADEIIFTIEQSVSTINAGEEADLSIVLKTDDPTDNIKNLTGTIVSKGSNVVVEEGFGQDKIDDMSNPSLDFKISSPMTASAGECKLMLTISYVIGEDTKTQNIDILINVESDINVNGIEITEFSIPDPVAVGDSFKVGFTLKNNSGIDLNGVEVSLPDLGDRFIIDEDFPIETIQIKNGESESVEFDLIALDGISSVRETISVLVKYVIGGEEFRIQRYVNISCNLSNASSSDYNIFVNGDIIYVGSNQVLGVSLQAADNTRIASATATLKSNSSNVIIESGNSRNASIIGTSANFAFSISSPIWAEAGTYTLTLNATILDHSGSVHTKSFDIPVRVVNNIDMGGLTFSSYTTDLEVIKPGDKFFVVFALTNNTGTDLTDVKVSLPSLSESKFVIDGGFTYKTVDIANGETATVMFDLIACDGISSVRETVTALAEYSIGGEKQSTTSDIILTCEPKTEDEVSGELDLTMTDYTVSSDRIRPDRVFTLTLTLKNSSDKDIEKARVNIGNLDGIKFAVNKGLTYKDFSIEAGETVKLSFELIGCEGISSTREVLPVEISYGNVSSTVYCTLSCKPEEKTQSEETEVFAPNIIITDYDFGGEFVVAGTKFPLTVTFENASNEAVIENLKITVNGASSSIDGSIAYSASNSANSFFFEKIETKGTNSITLEMLAKSDATPNSYPIDISFSYEYTVNGRRYQASPIRETINIPLQQEDRLVVNEPYYPNYVVYVGDYCYVSTSLVNMGKSGVYNVTASIRGEGFDMQESSYYIGNIESGREEYYDAELIPNMAGEINCELVVTYEDANGNQKEQVIPFTITAQEMFYEDVMWEEPIYDDSTMVEGPVDEGGLPSWVWYAIGGGAALIVLIVIIVVVKKKKSAKLGVDEDDEDI